MTGKTDKQLAQEMLDRCEDNEPVFLLRGRDVLSADLVDVWAIQAGLLPTGWEKVRAAKRISQDMREWPGRKNPD